MFETSPSKLATLSVYLLRLAAIASSVLLDILHTAGTSPIATILPVDTAIRSPPRHWKMAPVLDPCTLAILVSVNSASSRTKASLNTLVLILKTWVYMLR